MTVATGVYYPYPFPLTPESTKDLLLFFDELLVIDAGEAPTDQDLEFCLEQGIVRVVAPRDLPAQKLDRVMDRLPKVVRSIQHIDSLAGWEYAAGLGPPVPIRPSREEVERAWATDPRLVALRQEIGLSDLAADAHVAIRGSKFGGHYSGPASGRLLQLANWAKAGDRPFSTLARSGLDWVAASGCVMFERKAALALMASLAVAYAEQFHGAVVTDSTGGARLFDSMLLGGKAEDYEQVDDYGTSPLETLRRRDWLWNCQSGDPQQERAFVPSDDADYGSVPFAEATGALIRIAMRSVTLSPLTPIEDVLTFRDRHRADLVAFHELVESLAQELREQAVPADRLGRYIERAWAREIEMRLDRLEDARRRAGFKAGPDLLRAAFYSSAPPLASAAAGARGNTVLTVTAVSGLVGLYVSAKRVQAEWRETLSESPVSYLYQLRAAAKKSSL